MKESITIEIFKNYQLEIKSRGRKIASGIVIRVKKKNYHVIFNLSKKWQILIDLKTVSVEVWKNKTKFLCIAVYNAPNNIYYYDILLDLDKRVPGYPLPGLSASIPITRYPFFSTRVIAQVYILPCEKKSPIFGDFNSPSTTTVDKNTETFLILTVKVESLKWFHFFEHHIRTQKPTLNYRYCSKSQSICYSLLCFSPFICICFWNF